MVRMLCVLSIVMILVACKEKSEPKLVIKDETLEFTIQEPEQTLVIANLGEATLEWSLVNVPEWLEADRLSGSLVPGVDGIKLFADPEYEPGVHRKQITVNSNGGIQTVSTEFTQNLRDYIITPGRGITGATFLNTHNEIRNTIGDPDTVVNTVFDQPLERNVHNEIYLGLDLELVYSNFSDSRVGITYELVWIYCYLDFPGKTDKEITMGGSISEIEAKYGTNNVIISAESEGFYSNLLLYNHLGIGFYFYNNLGTYFQVIEIFRPYSYDLSNVNQKPLLPKYKAKINPKH